MEFHALWNDGSNACGGWEEVMLLLNVITVSVTMFGADFRLVAVSNQLLTSNQLKLFLLKLSHIQDYSFSKKCKVFVDLSSLTLTISATPLHPNSDFCQL